MELCNLKEKAQSVMTIPEHYVLTLEDSVPHGDESRRYFIWENPGNADESIEIELDLLDGSLVALNVTQSTEQPAEEVLSKPSIDEALAVAKSFLSVHNKESALLTLQRKKEGSGHYSFTFRQAVGGLPLPSTGCKITVNHRNEITGYRCFNIRGVKALPQWPPAIADSVHVKNAVLQALDMMLMYTELHPSLYDVEPSEHQCRLVYAPAADLAMIDAVTGRNLFGPEHYVMPPSLPIAITIQSEDCEGALPDGSMELKEAIQYYEELLGINRHEYDREMLLEDEQTARIVYYGKTVDRPQETELPLTINGYMQRKWGDQLRRLDASYRLTLERSSNRLIGYHANMAVDEAPIAEPRRDLLSREQCWAEAQVFLGQVFPCYGRYLQLEEDMTDSESDDRAFFYMPLYVCNIPVNNERAAITVCKVTGKVLMYRGVSNELIRELESCQQQPLLSASEAHSLYSEHVKASLRWFVDDSGEAPYYRLIYDVMAGKGRRLKYVDALSGQLVWERANHSED